MTTVARTPRGREIAAFATLYTAGALSSGLVPCLASSDSSPPQPSAPPRRDEDRDREHPSDDEPPAEADDDGDAVSSLGAVYLARLADVETDGDLPTEYFARKATHGTTYGATLAAHIELAGVDLPTAAHALARGLSRACARRWVAGDREIGGLLTGLHAIHDGEAAVAQRKAIEDGLVVDSDLDAVLGTLACAALGEPRYPLSPWYLAFSTFEALSSALSDDEEILRATMLRTIEALALDRMWGPR